MRARWAWIASGLVLAGCNDGETAEVHDGGAAEDAGGAGSSGPIDNTKIKPANGCGEDATEPCTDAYGLSMCPVDTGWSGDGLAPCAPEAGKGLLLHYGPSDYDDPAEIGRYALAANSEDENCVFVQTPNEQDVYLGAYHGRMRPGSHHLIVYMVDDIGTTPLDTPVPCGQTDAVGARWLLGSQDPQIDLARGGALREAGEAKPGDPDYRVGTLLRAKQYLRINMHYLNPTDRPVLRESWVYLEIVPKAEVETFADMITFFQGNIDVPPGAESVSTAIGKCTADTDRYVGLATGHFHENGTRFSIWHEKGGGDRELVYETYDWENPGNAFYADRAQMPVVDRDAYQWGAKSGYLHVKAGEAISFQCEFDNPTDTTVRLGETGKDQMCNVFGMYYPSEGNVWSCQCWGEICF